jgi:methyltransferase family protein
VPGGHADRLRWNARYGAGFVPSFVPHPLAVRVFGSAGSAGSAGSVSPDLPDGPLADLPDGPLADLACGPSGAALLAAASGRRVTAVDVSEMALGMLGAEARRRGLGHLITGVHADLSAWRPEPRSYAVVLCTGFWASAVFTAAAEGVAAGGLLGWEAFTAQARRARPSLPADWCLAPGEPASLLPPDFTLLDQHDRGQKRQLLARRAHIAAPEPHVPLPTTRPQSRAPDSTHERMCRLSQPYASQSDQNG